MKQCAICSKNIDDMKEPAILFIGRYGHHYELCPDCEGVMERFIAPEAKGDREAAADILYHRIFDENTGRKSAEMLDYIKALFSENSETLAEAEQSVREYREEAKALEESGDADTDPDSDIAQDAQQSVPALSATDDGITEEEFVALKTPKTPFAIKLVFLFLFLLIGGGAIAYGIIESSVFSVVVGAIITLLGLTSVFAKD